VGNSARLLLELSFPPSPAIRKTEEIVRERSYIYFPVPRKKKISEKKERAYFDQPRLDFDPRGHDFDRRRRLEHHQLASIPESQRALLLHLYSYRMKILRL